MTESNNYINYIEFKSKDLEETKLFYSKCFKWEFTDYGPNYIAFSNSGLEGGFEKTEEDIVNGVLVVLYHANLEETIQTVQNCGGKISKNIFSFPGGRRFEFLDPSGNELAVWTHV